MCVCVQVYHSKFNKEGGQELCGCAVLPIKPQGKTYKLPATLPDDADIVDEALFYFRANVLFRTYSVEGAADRVLIYLTLYITRLLQKLATVKDKTEGQKAAFELAREQFLVPGDGGFALGGMVPGPKSSQERDGVRQYFAQLRQELADRLVNMVYTAEGAPDKWWMSFSKRKFLNITMTK